jgi:hypothetical protein
VRFHGDYEWLAIVLWSSTVFAALLGAGGINGCFHGGGQRFL